MEYLGIVNMSVYFLAQVEGGRTMGDEAGNWIEVIGMYMYQNHSSAVKYFLWERGAIEELTAAK